MLTKLLTILAFRSDKLETCPTKETKPTIDLNWCAFISSGVKTCDYRVTFR